MLHNVRKLLNHGKRRIVELEMYLAYRNSARYEIFAEPLPNGNSNYKLRPKVKDLIQIDWEIQVMEAINALRAVLDHMIFVLIPNKENLNETGKGGLKSIEFKCYNSKADCESQIYNHYNSMNLSPTYINLLKSLEPYNEGNQILYDLHQYWNTSKHRNIIAVSMQPNIAVQFFLQGGAASFPPPWDEDREECY